MPTAAEINEAKLPDLLIDLYDAYGAAFPKPMGQVVQFSVVDESTTFPQAQRKIVEILRKHRLLPANVTIIPGGEYSRPVNRKIVLCVSKDLLM